MFFFDLVLESNMDFEELPSQKFLECGNQKRKKKKNPWVVLGLASIFGVLLVVRFRHLILDIIGPSK